MRLPIGKVIYSLRKDMSVTQEELASSVGVSVPAVSKWESGQAYPDITMLPSIARYFNTSIDNLLKYEINLSNDEVMDIIAKCAASFEKDATSDALAMCERYLYQYPNNYFLKLRMAALYMNYLSSIQGELKIEELAIKAIRLLEQSAQSEDLDISQSSNYLLSTLYVLIDESSKAEEALARIPKNLVNPEDMLVPLYIQQQRFTEAKKLLQTNMYSRVQHINQALSSFSHIIYMEGDPEYSEELLFIKRKLIKLFNLGAASLLTNNLELTQFYAKLKNQEKTLEYVEEIINSLQDLSRTSVADTIHDSRIFSHIELMKPLQSADYLKQSLVKLFDSSQEFDFIRDNACFHSLVNQLQAIWSE